MSRRRSCQSWPSSGPGQDLRVTVPGHGGEAPAEDRKPRRCDRRPGDTEPPVGGLEDGVLHDERPAAVRRPPELERASGLLAEVLPQGGAEDRILDGQRELDLDREGSRRRSEDAQQRGDPEQRRAEPEPPGEGRPATPRTMHSGVAALQSTHRWSRLQHTRRRGRHAPRLAPGIVLTVRRSPRYDGPTFGPHRLRRDPSSS